MWRIEAAVLRVQQYRIDKNALAVDEDVVAALEMIESPTFTACGATRSEPIDQYKAGVAREIKFLMLPVSRTGKRLDGVRRKDKYRTAAQLGLRCMRTRKLLRVTINLGRGLRAEKTTRFKPNAQLEMRLVTSHKSTAKVADVIPHASTARTGRKKFQRAGSAGRYHCAFAKNELNFQARTTVCARSGFRIFLEQIHCFTQKPNPNNQMLPTTIAIPEHANINLRYTFAVAAKRIERELIAEAKMIIARTVTAP